MRILRLMLVLVCALVVMTSDLGGTPQMVMAQQPNACRTLADNVLSAVKTSCGSVAAGSACYGYDSVKATGASADFAVGKSADLTSLTALQTSGANPDKKLWGVAVLNIQLTDDKAGPAMRAVLFGDATLTSTVRSDAAKMPTVTVETFDTMPVLLRAAASTSQPKVAQLASKVKAEADGRNAKGTWVRVRSEDDAVGWAPVSLLNVTGDVNTLTVLDDDDIVPHFLYIHPMQAVTLTGAAKDSCVEATSGLLLQANNDKVGSISINGVRFSMDKASVLVRAVAKESLDIVALAGKLTVRVYGSDIELNAGAALNIRLGGKSGFVAIAPPGDTTKPRFTALAGAPVDLLTTGVPCMTGVLTSAKPVTVYGGPDTKKYAALSPLRANTVYRILGWNQDAANTKWWKLESSSKTTEAWIVQEGVSTIGACGDVAKAEPAVVTAGGGGSNSGGGGGNGGGGSTSFAPTAKTIWNADVGTDQLQGTCGSGPLNYCSQLVAITPSGNDLLWKGQELKVYTLTRSQTNTYVYSGRNGVGDGNIKFVLVFTSPTTFTMTQTLILDSEPTCSHVNVFTATLRN